MKTITLKIVVTENKIATLENATGLPSDQIESHLLIIGLLENLKQKHLDKLRILYEKTMKKNEDL